ncbi:unnamed protein product, partial [marine sediment metagenome]
MIDHTEWIENGNTDLEMRLEPHENVEEMENGSQEIGTGISTDGTATTETHEEPRLKRLLLAEDLPSYTRRQLSSVPEEDAPPPESSIPNSGVEDSLCFELSSDDFRELDDIETEYEGAKLNDLKLRDVRKEIFLEARLDSYKFA